MEAQGRRFLFDLAGRLKWVASQDEERWPGTQALLRRTLGNRWLLYDGRGYDAARELTGRYYLPQPLSTATVEARLGEFPGLAGSLGLPGFRGLASQAAELWRVLGGTVPVLPPECLKVDYDVIPLLITRGCLHNCGFCAVKSGVELERPSMRELKAQLEGLARLLGPDLANYNSLFLGQNDGLAAEPSLLLEVAQAAFHRLGLGRSTVEGSHLFLFASPDSLLAAPDRLFLGLESLPFQRVFINVGLESFHGPTLEGLGRPVPASRVEGAFRRGLELASPSRRLSISFNLVIGPQLPGEHLRSMEEQLSRAPASAACTIYISPLLGHGWREGELRRRILRLKACSRLPLRLYSIVPL